MAARATTALQLGINDNKAYRFPKSATHVVANAGDTRDDIRVQSLVWEDPLEKGMVTHSNTLLGENSMDRGA